MSHMSYKDVVGEAASYWRIACLYVLYDGHHSAVSCINLTPCFIMGTLSHHTEGIATWEILFISLKILCLQLQNIP